MGSLRTHLPEAIAYAPALLVGIAFVWGGYWIPPLELRVALSVPTFIVIGVLVWRRVRRIDPPLLSPRLSAVAVVVAAWLALAVSPYLVRSWLLHREAAELPAWSREKPFFRYTVVADNQIDYEGLQLARIPFDQVEAFYLASMESRGWRRERGWRDYGRIHLIFVKGHRKIAFHLGPCWEGNGTMVEIFRVSYWHGADDPGTGRRAWYRWVRQVEEAFRRPAE